MEWKKINYKIYYNGVNKGIIPLSKFTGKKAASAVMFASDYGLCLKSNIIIIQLLFGIQQLLEVNVFQWQQLIMFLDLLIHL